MSYEVKVLKTAQKDVKKLYKKYKNIKNDLLSLIEILESNPKRGIHLGKNFYKIRIKNSDNLKGKSGGYRVIYYLLNENNEVWILKVYSKSDIDNISDEYIFSLLNKEE
ncbi:MAG: type II toxin-antitoxin system RelE/ParE family toxin [Nautiliaceae bacterium]